MAKIDRIREQINYMKVWISIFVVTEIGLIGWLVTNFDALNETKFFLGASGFLILLAAIHVLNKKILAKINSLESL
jgi:hypothetical protein